jgi:hypothetical protein
MNNLTLYAQWSAISLTVNGQTGTTAITPVNFNATSNGATQGAGSNINITIITNNPDGYSASLGIDPSAGNPYSATNALVNIAKPAFTIPTGAGTGNSLTTANTWAIGCITWTGASGTYYYQSDNLGATCTNLAKVPTAGTSETIVQTAAPSQAAGDQLSTTIGTNASTALASGTYRNTLLYTVVANP